MKTMMLTGIRKMQMMEEPMPRIKKENEVLIRMKTVGVCGSDIHYYTQGKIGSQVVEYPFAVGHEGAGIVEKTGKKVTKVKPGDRIAIEPAMPCFECDQCRAGRHNTCLRLRFLGCPGQASGCLSEFIVMPESSCLPIPDSMSFDEAAISEPLAIGLYAVKQAGAVKQANAAILGFGPIGMSVMLCLKAFGAGSVFVSEKITERIKMAQKSGADLTGNPDNENIITTALQTVKQGFDVVFECCGKQEAIDQAVELVKPGGKIMIVGIPEFEFWSFKADKIRRNEITIMNVRRQNHCAEEAIKLIADKKTDVSNMPTHRFKFENTREAFEMVAGYEDGVMKAMIDF
ncbi:MAG: alcohol dehydrogenase catalytic domain-containing protein [Bacteroidales bacterium]|nr:alcohol dehydrogenase catalytic domain-containing protein [Bacteroidales bacterium]